MDATLLSQGRGGKVSHMLMRCDTCRHCTLFDKPVNGTHHGCKMSVKLTRYDSWCTWWKETDKEKDNDCEGTVRSC